MNILNATDEQLWKEATLGELIYAVCHAGYSFEQVKRMSQDEFNKALKEAIGKLQVREVNKSLSATQKK